MPQKQFVRAKPLKEGKEKNEYKGRQNKKNFSKKYEEKPANKEPTRQPIKYMISTFKQFNDNQRVKKLIKQYPKFFCQENRKPDENIHINLNDCLWIGGKRQIIPRATKQMSSDSSEPMWDTESDKEVQLISKKIDEKIVQKVSQSLPRMSRKPGELQRHEKQFLEDYYMSKKIQRQSEAINESTNKAKETQKDEDIQKKKQVEKKTGRESTEWAEYESNVNALINKGFMEKVDNDQLDFVENQDDEFSYEEEKSSEKPSSSEDDDDMFTDEGPRTVKIVLKKTQSEIRKEEPKEIVKINNHYFTKIAEKLGASATASSWMISNKVERFKVSTQYMDEYYHLYKMNITFPYVSLNSSAFTHVDEIQTGKGLEQLQRKLPKNRDEGGKVGKKKKYPHYNKK